MRVSTSIIQNAFGKYLKDVIDGKDVIITKNERGVAKLVPYQDPMVTMVSESTAEYYLHRRVTFSEYLEISNNSETRYELIDGELFLMASPTHRHQVVIGELLGQFYNYFKGKKCSALTAPFDVRLMNDSLRFEDDPNVVQPDILVICDEEAIDEAGKYHGVPALVVEVLSPSTRSKDMVKKLSLYMLSGVKEYWIVDLEQNQILVYAMHDKGVESLKVVAIGEMVQSKAFEGLVVDTREFA
ncbi:MULTISPECIES: type II toxin-antitoxin system prevent-host-death family antitoxin [unclassified Fusibacter]|uniref:type II toxin-antitoxin system prevent-host-death family antitoxin n=1 Tax=unclassified Fusibacter TaxID=2624464 RepID=UPI00101301F5|nr:MULTISPECIES: type II toxin-antitoxin system prevent-host-death family antitoxin [unclassified Fusibacter]MCK8058432.1 type II toxin-antitoxin system prevent-host-death family antitoxin [Fusibacter sp. A2]NPE22800.1 type II toxin-antitoxin system prevent-host-death family antitoxin [Fusibacter sp. A1]RXV60355.1 type II toxin-antitoxin system prevent-host-death family antitoxin [Fusibacter sp. A1]